VSARWVTRASRGVLGVASVSLAAACSAGGQGAPGGPTGSGGTSTGTGGSTGMSGSGAGPGSIAVGDLAKTCGTSSVGRPQLRRLTRAELQNTLDDIFPQVKGKWAVAYSEVKSLTLGFDNDPALLTVGGQVAEKLLETAESVATAVTADDVLPNLLPCASSSPNRACAQTFLNDYGRRSRRPIRIATWRSSTRASPPRISRARCAG
jgi:hypothetical protein